MGAWETAKTVGMQSGGRTGKKNENLEKRKRRRTFWAVEPLGSGFWRFGGCRRLWVVGLMKTLKQLMDELAGSDASYKITAQEGHVMIAVDGLMHSLRKPTFGLSSM